MWFDGLARIGQGNCISPMQKQGYVCRGKFLGDGAAYPAARTGDEITFHLSGSQTLKHLMLHVQRPIHRNL